MEDIFLQVGEKISSNFENKDFRKYMLISKKIMKSCLSEYEERKKNYLNEKNAEKLFEILITREFMKFELSNQVEYYSFDELMDKIIELMNSTKEYDKLLSKGNKDWIPHLELIIEHHIDFELIMGCKSNKEYTIVSNMREYLIDAIEKLDI